MTDQIAPRRDMANAIRALAMDAVQQADSGHPGMPMGMADVATVLFTKFMKFDASEPHWPDRDRFILSAGHGSMLLYSLLHLTGYEDMTLDRARRRSTSVYATSWPGPWYVTCPPRSTCNSGIALSRSRCPRRPARPSV